MFVALGIEHAMCLHSFLIYGLPGSTVFFHVISYTARFSVTSYRHIKFLSLSLSLCMRRLSETFLNLRRIERDMIKHVRQSSRKVPVIVVRFE